MKKLGTMLLLGASLLLVQEGAAQGARKSPAATVSQQINTGTHITIDYSQPSLKGRTIGVDVEPMEGKVWRMGANEATTITFDKDVRIEGQTLPAGKYSLFGVSNGKEFTLIFNKATKIWGTQYEQNKSNDVLQVKVTPEKAEAPAELLTYTIDREGKVALTWGNMVIPFFVQ